MRIVVINNFNIHEQGAGGGAAKVPIDMAKAFAFYGNQVMFLYPHDRFELDLKNENITYLGIPSKGEFENRTFRMTSENIKTLESYLNDFNPDVIHSHSESMHAIALLRYAMKVGKPYFFSAHVLPSKFSEFVNQEGFGVSFYKSWFFKKQLLSFYNSCSCVVVLNEEARVDVRKFGYKGEIEIVPNPIDLQFYSSKTTHFENRFNLIYSGHLSERKNQMFLLKVLSNLDGRFKLTLVGRELEKSYTEKLYSFAEENRLNVIFTGQIAPIELQKLYEESGIFVSSSKLEVQSLVLLEAMSNGIPVVALANETVREYLGGYSYVIDDESEEIKVQKFVDAINEITSLDKDSFQELERSLKKRVEKNDPERVVEQLESLYSKYLGKKLKTSLAFNLNFALNKVVSTLRP